MGRVSGHQAPRTTRAGQAQYRWMMASGALEKHLRECLQCAECVDHGDTGGMCGPGKAHVTRLTRAGQDLQADQEPFTVTTEGTLF